ncbi:hypothetical protein CDL12_08522 [Handroanthus impetiginosus]|uniref:Uncharacterized protein n=1 Tax=Handroanthus impetiginosus TaxID=429701 RepID=A0A2G9HMR6_9LAMI|nr:hypothetical protein CDL12_08522 [Handroanthus impetiginosus]
MMETAASDSALGYGKPPWIFKGSALYQLHLVKAQTARAFIPKEFKLVEAFGYKLAFCIYKYWEKCGFFLANYEDSPAGIFDELVVIAGIVWNPPTSCAWAARVLVSSDKACLHGRKDVGLPSQVANFTKSVKAVSGTKRSQFGGFLNKIGMDNVQNSIDIQVKEMNSHTAMDICSIKLTGSAPQRWMGPAVKISLPSFSGRTEYKSDLLKYSCQIECRLRAVTPAKVSVSSTLNIDDETTSEMDFSSGDSGGYKRNLSISMMLSKPILALEFSCLKIKVEAPSVVVPQ